MENKIKTINRVLDAEARLDATLFSTFEPFLLRFLDINALQDPLKHMVRFARQPSQILLNWRNCARHTARIGELNTGSSNLLESSEFFGRELQDEAFVMDLENRAQRHLQWLEQTSREGSRTYAEMTASIGSPAPPPWNVPPGQAQPGPYSTSESSTMNPRVPVAVMIAPQPTLSNTGATHSYMGLQGTNSRHEPASISEQQKSHRLPDIDHQSRQPRHPPFDHSQGLQVQPRRPTSGPWQAEGLTSTPSNTYGENDPRLTPGDARIQIASMAYGRGGVPGIMQSHSSHSRVTTLQSFTSDYGAASGQASASANRPTGGLAASHPSMHPQMQSTRALQQGPSNNPGFSGGLAASHPAMYTPGQPSSTPQQGSSNNQNPTGGLPPLLPSPNPRVQLPRAPQPGPSNSQSSVGGNAASLPSTNARLQPNRTLQPRPSNNQSSMSGNAALLPAANTQLQPAQATQQMPLNHQSPGRNASANAYRTPTTQPSEAGWRSVPQRPQPQHSEFARDLFSLLKKDEKDDSKREPRPVLRSYTAEQLERAKLLADPHVLEHSYYKYLNYFPLAPGETVNPYYKNLLANFYDPGDDDTGERAKAIRYAKKHWYNLWELKDMEYVKTLVKKEEREEEIRKERERAQDPRTVRRTGNP